MAIATKQTLGLFPAGSPLGRGKTNCLDIEVGDILPAGFGGGPSQPTYREAFAAWNHFTETVFGDYATRTERSFSHMLMIDMTDDDLSNEGFKRLTFLRKHQSALKDAKENTANWINLVNLLAAAGIPAVLTGSVNLDGRLVPELVYYSPGRNYTRSRKIFIEAQRLIDEINAAWEREQGEKPDDPPREEVDEDQSTDGSPESEQSPGEEFDVQSDD